MVDAIKIRLLLLVFMLVGVVGALIGVAWMLAAIIFAPRGARAWQILLGFDRLFNATMGGNGKETLSSRAGRLMQERGWACQLCKFLDGLKKDHCKDSVGV